MPTVMEQKSEQDTQSGVMGVLATIMQSGCTNICAYNVAINADGSATASTIASTHSLLTEQKFPAGTIDTLTLQDLLTQIGDVSRIPTGTCPKPASFATTTRIVYAGKTSGDLQCIQQTESGDQALLHESEQLARLVLTILVQLKLDDRRLTPNQ